MDVNIPGRAINRTGDLCKSLGVEASHGVHGDVYGRAKQAWCKGRACMGTQL